MCGDCWNAAMGAPAAVVAARFAWVGYKDRIPFLGRRDDGAVPPGAVSPDATPPAVSEDDPVEELVDTGASPP